MDDKKLIKLYYERSEQAISSCDAKYGGYMLRIAGNILPVREDSEECVQDSHLKLWNAMPPAMPQCLRTFIGKITRNTAIDMYDKASAEKRGGGELPLVLSELSDCIEGSSIESEVDMALLAEAVNDFLAALSPAKRRLFVRRYWFADPIKSIAASEGLNENTIKVNLSRIRASLKEVLTKEGFNI